MIFEIISGILFLLFVASIPISIRYHELGSSLLIGTGGLMLAGLIVMSAIGLERQVDIDAREFCESQSFEDYYWDGHDIVCQNFSEDKVSEKLFIRKDGKFYESSLSKEGGEQ